MPTPGDEVVKVIRERGFTFPILVVSAWARPEEALTLEMLGIAGFMEKPFDFRKLMDDVERLLCPKLMPY